MNLIDGNVISAVIRGELKGELSEFGERPSIAGTLLGKDPVSATYVRNKERACEMVGMRSEVLRLPKNTGEEETMSKIEEINDESNFNGIFVQLPLPPQINEKKIIRRIDTIKDVDGFHPINLSLLIAGEPRFVPRTPLGIRFPPPEVASRLRKSTQLSLERQR